MIICKISIFTFKDSASVFNFEMISITLNSAISNSKFLIIIQYLCSLTNKKAGLKTIPYLVVFFVCKIGPWAVTFFCHKWITWGIVCPRFVMKTSQIIENHVLTKSNPTPSLYRVFVPFYNVTKGIGNRILTK